MNSLKNLSIKGKIWLCITLGVLCLVILIVALVVKSQNQTQTAITVGKGTVQQDARTYPDYQTSNGDRVTIIQKSKLTTTMTDASINRLETNLKRTLYEKTGKIPSLVSINSDVTSESQVDSLSFVFSTDVDSTNYRVFAKVNGTIITLEEKK